MTGILTTKIEFVASQTSGLAPTGDILMILACILAAIAAVTTFVLLRKFKKATASATANDATNFKDFFTKKKPLAITACTSLILAIILCVVSNMINSNPAFADEQNAGVQAADVVKATVDEQTGQITIEDGFINNQNPYKLVNIKKTSVSSDASIENAIWSIKLKDQELYGTQAGAEIDNNINLDKKSENTIKFNLAGLDTQVAKDLVGKTPITVNFSYSAEQIKATVQGKLSITQNDKQKATRPISADNQTITFFDENQQKYTSTTNSEGIYNIPNVPLGSKGQIATNIIGCKTQNITNANTQDHKIHIDKPIEDNLINQNFTFEGPELDFYTLDELKTASQDIAANTQSSLYINEFLCYMKNDEI